MEGHTSYRTYWMVWVLLLILTIVMIFVEAARLPAAATVLLLTIAMFVKAGMIGTWFMHLRYETRALVLAVVLGTLITAAFLWFLLIPDALATLEMSPR
ncbi:MAG: cytochrome C oxidase subunit IV family protein [Gemmatimonadota bacterium]